MCCSWALEPSASRRCGRRRSARGRSEEHTSELQSRLHLVCRLLLEKKNKVMLLVPCHNKLTVPEAAGLMIPLTTTKFVTLLPVARVCWPPLPSALTRSAACKLLLPD